MDYNILNELSTVTTIPIKDLKNLSNRSNELICHGVLECVKLGDTEAVFDIGLGTVKISILDDELFYRFEPSTKLEKMLIESVSNNSDPLIKAVEDKITDRILRAYKDLM